MKKTISLLLAVVMVFSLFPIGVLAADGDDVSNVNPVTGREQGPKGDQKVAMMLYGESISDAVMKSNYDIDDFWAALKIFLLKIFLRTITLHWVIFINRKP